jgi:hypothetical protein
MELIQEFVEFLLQMAFWYFVFSLIGYMIGLYYKNKSELYNEAVEDVRKRVHIVKQEKHGDQYYWFDMETDQFLAQGGTFDEIAGKLKQYFVDHVFITEKFSVAGPDFVPRPLTKEVVDNWPKSSV